MSHPNAAQGPAAVFQMLGGAQATAVVSTSIRLGVFAALASGPAGVDEVAARVKCPARSTRILLNALTVLGLLVKEGATYRLGPMAEGSLVPGRPGYAGDMANINGHPLMWEALGRLKEAVQSGGTVLEQHAETPGHPFWEDFAKYTAGFSTMTAMAVEKSVHDFVASKPKVRVLDVAAGSGMYGFTMLQNPNVELTSLDWPNVLVHTRKRAEEMGLDAKRVKYLEGDLFQVDFGGPYDVIILSQIYHHFDEATCVKLTRKVAAALAPGGKAVIHDFVTDDEVKNPAAAMFSVTMLVWTRQGEAYSANDYERWLLEAGLSKPKTAPFEGSPTSILVAEKT
jgi:C-methyltransferase